MTNTERRKEGIEGGRKGTKETETGRLTGKSRKEEKKE
jgi:hypothetical protein